MSDSDESPAAAGKAPDAFRTISEVAEELGLPQHVLRFWETRFTQIRPMKRGGGRRYYRPQDVELLRGIRHLLYGEGYTIKGVQRLLREQGLRFVAAAAQGTVPVPIAAAESAGVTRRSARDEEDEGLPRVLSTPGSGLKLRPAEPDDEEAEDEADDEPPPRLAAKARGAAAGMPPALAADEVKRLKATLADLLECKRLLDQAR